MLAYCMRGFSRSPTIVIGYLMHAKRWSLADSYRFVKERRQLVHINEEDTQRLLALEQQLLSSSSVPGGNLAVLDLTIVPSADGSSGRAAEAAQTLGAAPNFPTANPFGAGGAWSISSAQPEGMPAFGAPPQQANLQQQQQPAQSFAYGTGSSAPNSGAAGGGSAAFRSGGDMEM